MNIIVKIESYDHQGRGISHYNNKVMFIPNALLNEELEVKIIEEKKNYLIGNITKIITPSPLRITPKCPYYDKCGGCNFLHINHQEELNIKKDILINIFNKYAKLTINPQIINSPKEFNYRNKIELKIDNYNWGYYNEKTHNIVEIDNCLLAKESINKIISSKELFEIKHGDIIIRSNYNDEILIKINTKDSYKIDIDTLTKNNKIVGIIVNNKIIYGEDNYIEIIDKYLYKVNINSFFQINIDILKEVFKIISKEKYEHIVDLYCGVGTLGIPMQKDKLYGIEIVPEAIKDAITNSKMNKQNNYYLLGDSTNLNKIKDEIDCIIVDPPRSGLNDETLSSLLNYKPQNLIYMSCNPLTLARDINNLKEYYNLKEIYLLDMFPRTKHVECVCVLKIR